MTAPVSAPPAGPSALPPVRATVARALALVRQHPREALLPLAVIQLPVTLATAALTIVLYLTAFKNEPVETMQGALSGGASAPLFVFAVTAAVEGLFAQVARAASIVSIAAVARGRPLPLTSALDPAFTRMGALLVLVLIIAVGFGLAFVTIVGLVLLPYVATRVALCFEAMVLEGIGPWAAIRRSWSLTRGNVLRLLGVILLSVLVVLIPLVLISALGTAIGGGRTTRVVLTGLYTFVQGGLAIPLAGFLTATTTLYYLTIGAPSDDRRSA